MRALYDLKIKRETFNLKKRNITQEISAIKDRAGFVSRYSVIHQINRLKYIFSERINLEADPNFQREEDYEIGVEIYKYIPIAIATCFETFFQSAVKEFIDFGEPYITNASKFNQSQNVRFDFEITNAIGKKTVTIGEVVAHLLSFNNIEDINALFTSLLGDRIAIGSDFIAELKSFKKLDFSNGERSPVSIPLNNPEEIIKQIRRTYELRHIFCHEATPTIKITRHEMLSLLDNASEFLQFSNDYFYEKLYPNAPQTTSDMLFAAGQDFEKAEKELEAIVLSIKTALECEPRIILNPLNFEETIIAWKNYRDSNAKFHSGKTEDIASITSILYLSSATEMTKEKIENLRLEYDYYLRKYGR